MWRKPTPNRNLYLHKASIPPVLPPLRGPKKARAADNNQLFAVNVEDLAPPTPRAPYCSATGRGCQCRGEGGRVILEKKIRDNSTPRSVTVTMAFRSTLKLSFPVVEKIDFCTDWAWKSMCATSSCARLQAPAKGILCRFLSKRE